MSRHRLLLTSSTLTATLLAAATMLTPASRFVPSVRAQTTSTDANGSSDRTPEQIDTRFDNAEAYDKASVEANPYAPDDSEQATAAAAPGLYPIPVPLPGGLGHVANGVGTRNAGYGTIRLRGAPAGAARVVAYLYWGTIQNAPPPAQTILFNGVKVSGRLIGTGQSCWCGGVFAAYRASVIALINPGINGDYRVSAMPSAVTDGSDPWNSPCVLPLSEGASLVVGYAHNSIPAAAQLFINDGTVFFAAGTVNINNPLPAAVAPYKQLRHTRLGGDGQVGGSTSSNLPITDERTTLGPALTQIKGPASPFNGDSDWNGADGVPLNQLWDTHTDSFTKVLVPFGAPNYLVTYSAKGDCIYAVAHILNTF